MITRALRRKWKWRRTNRLDLPAPEIRHGRAVLRVRGGDLWFECDDAPLEPVMEAFLGVLLLPAMTRGITLRAEVPVDPTWLAGARRNVARYGSWWNYNFDPLAELQSTGFDSSTPPVPAAGAGVCFTGGVDSFNELLRDPGRYSHLVFVHGPDIPLNDRRRAANVRATMDDVASELDKQVLWVRTNLLQHSLTRIVPWERAHGPGLAAAGHLLRRTIGSLTIAASYAAERLIHWSSRPDTDPDWSSSSFKVIHGDASQRRRNRLAAIVDHPLVHRHLRVCTKRRTLNGNCSTCRKCIGTMASLMSIGWLEKIQTFDHSVPFARRLDELSYVEERVLMVWRDNHGEKSLPPDVAAALCRLIERSEQRPRKSSV